MSEQLVPRRPRRNRLVQVRVTEPELLAWHAAALRRDLPLAMLVRMAMREVVADSRGEAGG